MQYLRKADGIRTGGRNPIEEGNETPVGKGTGCAGWDDVSRGYWRRARWVTGAGFEVWQNTK